ncbi:hypothetical protein QZN11_34275 [Streptomyces gramineus]|uniref:acyl-CoA thioesterase n=1 Tax=Streptomyces gramineus TaxID=910542 RepID=UPI00398A5C71
MTGTGAQHLVQVRWPDLDGLGHVNHTAVLALLEVGRDAVLGRRGLLPHQYVVRHCEVSYEGELRPTGPDVVYRCDSLAPGTTSVRTRERLLDDQGRTAVTAVFTLVRWDADAHVPRPLTDEERERLSDLQEETA